MPTGAPITTALNTSGVRKFEYLQDRDKQCRQLVWCNKQADEGECHYKYCVKCIAAKLYS